MEPRKITVISTKTQGKKVIMSSATTLGELKQDLRTAGVDYTDMTFLEGLTKTELKVDESPLPTNVKYKENTTNELVFMLTNTNKKIKSGAMTRNEAYSEIKKRHLQSECVKRFGKNFTMCKTTDLIKLIEEVKSSSTKNTNNKESTKCCNKNNTTKEIKSNTTKESENKFVKAFTILVEALEHTDCIDSEVKEEILAIINDKPVDDAKKAPYSNSELDEMFDFV